MLYKRTMSKVTRVQLRMTHHRVSGNGAQLDSCHASFAVNGLAFAFVRIKEEFFLPCRGVAQPGSAPALGAGGRRFKSSRPDHSVGGFKLRRSEGVIR